MIVRESTGSSSCIWDKAAKDYDLSRRADPIYRACVEQATRGIRSNTLRCLDAGCGTGLTSASLADRCTIVVAVDYSFESLRVLKDKALANVIVVQADVGALPFADSVFDACVCANTLQHLKPRGPQERAVRELMRVARPRGTLSVSVHHYSMSKRKAGWTKEGKPGQPGIDYIFRFSRDDLLSILPGSSVKSVGYYGLAKIPIFGVRLQHHVAHLFGKMAARLGHGHMLIGRTYKR